MTTRTRSKVLIAAKTHKGQLACIGGLSLTDNVNLRLLRADTSDYPGDTDFEVGQLWDVEYAKSTQLQPPHVEDVLVQSCKLLGRQENMKEFLLQRITAWRGGPLSLFDGLLTSNPNAHWYASRSKGVPSASVGYWSPDCPLTRIETSGGIYYRYHHPGKLVTCTIKYVGWRPCH